MDNKKTEEYEDISIDNTDDNQLVSNEDVDKEVGEDIDEDIDSNNSEEQNELKSIAKQLSNDYSKYFKLDINSEKKETEDAIEDLLTHFEEFCGLIEMIRNDNNICLEEVMEKISQKSKVMDEIYVKINRLEQFVQIVRQCVDDMDNELTKAEQIFGECNDNRLKKFFTSFISNSSKKEMNCRQIETKYEPKDIFKTSDYIKTCDFGQQLSQLTDNICDQNSQPIN